MFWLFRAVAGSAVRGLQGSVIPPGFDKWLGKHFPWLRILGMLTIPIALTVLVVVMFHTHGVGMNRNPSAPSHTYGASCWNADAHSNGSWDDGTGSWVCFVN
jgi:hypothetical protein